MIPILFERSETEFNTNGLGRISECTRCIVHEVRNGVFECEFDYPLTGRLYSELTNGRIIGCIHDDKKDLQPFEIYGKTAPMRGIVTFYAHHISYKASKIILKPGSASSIAQAMVYLKNNTYNDNPFTFWTDKTTTGKWSVDAPISIKEILGGVQGSILDVYGTGEYEWDKWTIKLHLHRGKESGVEIRYGKNLSDIRQETDSSGVYNAVVPYWYSQESEELVTLPEGVIISSGVELFTEVLTDHNNEALTDHNGNELEASYYEIQPVPLDLSDRWQEKPTVEQLRTKATSMQEDGEAWIPDENIQVDFVQLWQTEEYASVAPLQRVSLCDKVTVHYPAMGINAVKMQVVDVEYDVLRERFSKMELGKARSSFAEVVRANVESAILKQVPSTSMMEQAIAAATAMITGGLGGHVVFNMNADGQPEEILIMDTDDKATAVNVWRWNLGGLGHSSTGYEGPFSDVALTADGKINATMMTTGNLNANIIRSGIITDQQGKNYWNLETGEISISLDPGEEGEVTQADLARVESNAKTYADNKVVEAMKSYDSSETVTGKIAAAADGLKTEFQDTFAVKGDSVTNVETMYYLSTSAASPVGGSWQRTVPERTTGFYIWTRDTYTKADGTTYNGDPVCVTGNDGADGKDADDVFNLYIDVNKSTYIPKEKTDTVQLTARIGLPTVDDDDPNGTKYTYAWFLSVDNADECYFRKGKIQTININRTLCLDRAQFRFALVDEVDFFNLTDHNNNGLTDHNNNVLEAG